MASAPHAGKEVHHPALQPSKPPLRAHPPSIFIHLELWPFADWIFVVLLLNIDKAGSLDAGSNGVDNFQGTTGFLGETREHGFCRG